MNPAPEFQPNQFNLLRQRRFLPFFLTQFSGAGNDNLFKFGFTVWITYQINVSWLEPGLAGLVISAVFILPFLLFSATAGQLSDRLNKAILIRWIKNIEILVMLIAGIGFYLVQPAVLLFCIFLMGLHSTLFGPIKYALLPEILQPSELTGGNGMVEMGTFVAILLGNMAGGWLISMAEAGAMWVAFACLFVAILGRIASGFIPQSAALDPALKLNFNPFTETWRNIRYFSSQWPLLKAMLGISWLWFFGAVFLSQFPSFAKEVLRGNEQVASMLLVVFSVGIGMGSLLCEKLSRSSIGAYVEWTGLCGMGLFTVDVYFSVPNIAGFELLGINQFLAVSDHWRLLIDLFLLSLFAGLYSVPIYARIQTISQPTHRARVIASNNILNALFMIASSVLAGVLLKLNFTITEIFLLLGAANLMLAGISLAHRFYKPSRLS